MKTCAEIKQWKFFQCRFTEIPENVTENTFLFIYGWFGLWNDDLCSLDRVKMAFQTLKDIMKRINNIKIIIGMRSDLYKKYHQELGKYSDLFQHELFLDSVNINKDAEYLKYFHKRNKGLCKNKECQCRQLSLEMLCKGKDNIIGLPLRINILANYHELIGNYIRDPDILKVMTDAITTLRENIKKTNGCNWIDYICLKGRFSRSEEFDESIVEVFDLRITRSSFDVTDSILKRYVRMRYSDRQNNVSTKEAQYVFWHPFIYICVFHSLFKYNPNLVLKHCNVDAILQLVRPKGFGTAYIEVSADDHGIDLFYERLRKLHLIERYKDHPLVRSASK
uniref:Uncharacterized protein LOC111137587 isoform X1 n=1 Tax=Crassostrea virginica TaxID=6565 RepID=A0A8B8EXT6_CRAVI|nr:uncharacterized protein LOC111137587 isoform X1 [Crassostrea virginica]XP_022344809.1 uncharacterized protein LOC111137587 isoform X1 [Crassostrea virginica]